MQEAYATASHAITHVYAWPCLIAAAAVAVAAGGVYTWGAAHHTIPRVDGGTSPPVFDVHQTDHERLLGLQQGVGVPMVLTAKDSWRGPTPELWAEAAFIDKYQTLRFTTTATRHAVELAAFWNDTHDLGAAVRQYDQVCFAVASTRLRPQRACDHTRITRQRDRVTLHLSMHAIRGRMHASVCIGWTKKHQHHAT